tara:strand:+ start:392 stop:769 length:378 start_codon:yes stop_codon:yes gene_type:complete
MSCIFCAKGNAELLVENELAKSFYDAYPVTNSHVLVIPKRCCEDYFSLTDDELLACDDLLKKCAELIENNDPTVQGFNIGVNSGEVAGQTVFHCHFHLIPRRKGDVSVAKGGVRNVIPGKGDYCP